ncbi:MAG: stage V sporulation T C-terminal domain-containing protein [Bacilli bacterium]
MKTTGVVRRIDDLGRIVIPKEMRRTLRIRDGESLEIFVDEDFVALKKYSPLNDMASLAKTLADAIYSSINKNIIVTDRDNIIACSGSSSLKKKFLDKNISEDLLNIMNSRAIINQENLKNLKITKSLEENCIYYICPIVMNGDAIGLVLLFTDGIVISDTDKKIVQLASQILGKHIEE